jgi:acetyl esterase/lipase
MAWSAGTVFNALASEPGIAATTGIAYGPLPRHKLDIYRSPPRLEIAPVLIFYYGGGWTSGDRATYKFVGTALAAAGITSVIPDYRLYPEVKFPAFVDDAAMAYAWVAANLDPSGKRPVIVAGHSAGAHIAALLAYDASYLHRHAPGARMPAAMIGLAGPYAFDPTTWPTTRAIFATAAGSADQARPFTAVRAPAPPTLLLQASADVTVQHFNAAELMKALKQAGTPVTLIDYPGVGHTGLVLAISRPFRWRAPVLDDIASFVRATFQADPRVANRPAARTTNPSAR